MKYGEALASGWPIATGMTVYYTQRYRSEHHLARYDENTIERLNLPA